jgi:hypothetical protein
MASKLADAAYEWLKKYAGSDGVSSDDLWLGMQSRYPELTEVSDKRKTPRTTLMRDLRKDRLERFVVGNRRVKLRKSEVD